MYDIQWAPQLISKDSILQQNITKASSILQTESSLKEEYLKFEVTSNQNEGTWRIGMPKKSKLNFRMRGNRVDAKLSMKHFFPQCLRYMILMSCYSLLPQVGSPLSRDLSPQDIHFADKIITGSQVSQSTLFR